MCLTANQIKFAIEIKKMRLIGSLKVRLVSLIRDIEIDWIRHKCNDAIYFLWNAIFVEKGVKSINRFTLLLGLIRVNTIFV